VASHLGTTALTVYRWRKRFKDQDITGLKDCSRSGQPKKLSKEEVNEVLKMTVKCIPHEATHWSGAAKSIKVSR